MKTFTFIAAFLVLTGTAQAVSEMHAIDGFLLDRTEVSVGQFRVFVGATGFKTKAENEGGGLIYEAGWTQKAGWTWSHPFGTQALAEEPVVHVTFDEAAAYCQWAGKRLPTDAEWQAAAYTEYRTTPPVPFTRGQTYPYPTGETPKGANCLDDCGTPPAIDYSDRLYRGIGPALVGTTIAGVNGLFDMGANVWEWTEDGGRSDKRTRGGSWWYGALRMKADDRATKPRDMAVAYIGFRCAKDIN